MLTFFIVLLVLSACLAIKPFRQVLGGLTALLIIVMSIGWPIFWIYVAYHFITKYW